MTHFLNNHGKQLAVGIDIIEIARIKATYQRFGERFLSRIYTNGELQQIGNNITKMAGRFAVKEACSKAMGTGIGVISWSDIECLSDAVGKPHIILHGNAELFALQLGWQSFDVSISHTHTMCAAIVVALENFEVADLSVT